MWGTGWSLLVLVCVCVCVCSVNWRIELSHDPSLTGRIKYREHTIRREKVGGAYTEVQLWLRCASHHVGGRMACISFTGTCVNLLYKLVENCQAIDNLKSKEVSYWWAIFESAWTLLFKSWVWYYCRLQYLLSLGGKLTKLFTLDLDLTFMSEQWTLWISSYRKTHLKLDVR